MRTVNLMGVKDPLLERVRDDDIAGAAIPPLSFDFLRGTSAANLAPVLRHSTADSAALTALAVALVRQLEGVASCRPYRPRPLTVPRCI